MKILKKHGYRSFTSVPNVLRKHGSKFHFDDYSTVSWKKSAMISDKISDKAIDILKTYENKKPLFLWAHYIEPHFPYPDDPQIEIFGSNEQDKYDATLYYVDNQIKKLFDYIEQDHWTEDSIIIVMSDHGEEFWEHGDRFHGRQVYDESRMIPMAMCIPGVPHAEVSQPVSLIDVVPTLLNAVGVNEGFDAFEGFNLLPAVLKAEINTNRVLFTETWVGDKIEKRKVAVHFKNWRLIYSSINNSFELYNVYKDGKQQVNVIDREKSQANTMINIFKTWNKTHSKIIRPQ
jgi:arylsulfatase A-like enzyme